MAAACAIPLPNGAPGKPARGADFGGAVVKNTGNAVKRSAIANIAGRFGGGLGAAVGRGVANATVKNEEVIFGTWKITDTSSRCACEVTISGRQTITGKTSSSGGIKPVNCSGDLASRLAAWELGYSFTGYDAKLKLKGADRKSVLTTLNRDGVHYFSTTLGNGQRIVMWRAKQNYRPSLVGG